MTDAAPPSARRRLAGTVLLALATAGLAVIAGRLMFSAFMFYDDEGYVLLSLKNFAEHGGLYREVYSQYGPFPYAAWFGLHALGLPINHLTGRLVTLAAWMLVACGSALLVRRATRSLSAALATLAATFPYLWIMVSEPSHPGSLLALLVLVAAALGSHAIAAGRIDHWAWIAGATAGAAALTKINVGAFIVFAGLAWILLHHASPVVRRRAPALLAAGSVLLPLALMRPMLDLPWVQLFAAIFILSALACLRVADEAPIARVTWRTLGHCIAGGTAIVVLVLTPLFARGTTPAELLEGILLGPLRHPAAFNLSYTWPAGALAFAVGSLGVALFAAWAARRGRHWVHPLVAGLRLLATLGAVAAVLRFPAASPDRWVFGFGAPLIWVFVWRLPGETDAVRRSLTWLALLWLGQFLHPFPVAGSQIAWGTFLALPLAAIGSWSALRWLRDQAPETSALRRPALRPAAVGLALVAGVACTHRFHAGGERYRQGSDLALPGADLLRLPKPATALFRTLATNAVAHGDVLFSQPGMFSFNLWTSLPTPTLANVTHWFSLLSRGRQEAIIQALENHPRAVVIIHREHIAYLTQRSFAPAGPLHDYIAERFTPAFRLDDFEFCVRRGRTIDPLLLGEMLVYGEAAGVANTALRIRLPLPPGTTVARIELVSPAHPRRAALRLDAGNARAELTPTDPQGRATGASRVVAWPFAAEATAVATLHFDRFAQIAPAEDSLILCYDADGREIALARLKR